MLFNLFNRIPVYLITIAHRAYLARMRTFRYRCLLVNAAKPRFITPETVCHVIGCGKNLFFFLLIPFAYLCHSSNLFIIHFPATYHRN